MPASEEEVVVVEEMVTEKSVSGGCISAPEEPPAGIPATPKKDVLAEQSDGKKVTETELQERKTTKDKSSGRTSKPSH